MSQIGKDAAAGDAAGLPSWLKAEMFANLVRDATKDFSKIINFTSKRINENLIWIIWRVSIQVQLKDGKNRSFIYLLQTPKYAAEPKSTTNLMGIYTKQPVMYDLLLPAFETLYKDAADGGQVLNFSPRSYKLKPNPSQGNYVLLDDVQQMGYKNVNSWDGLDMAHMKAVLHKLAAFHAASVVYQGDTGAGLPKIFMQSTELEVYAATVGEARNSFVFRKFHESLRSCNLYKFEYKIKCFLESDVVQNINKTDKVEPLDFNVLLHGNLWCNNIFFHYDAFGHIKETLFVDFQASQWGSPARDLVYLLLSSTCWSDKLMLFDYYIKYYHDQLTDNLKLLKYSKPLPKLTDLHFAVLKNSYFAFNAIASILPIALLKESEFDSQSGVDLFQQMYVNRRYAEQIEQIVPWMENRGFFEH